MESESKTAVMAALAGNLALAGLKGVAAAATGSAAMLAETLHSMPAPRATEAAIHGDTGRSNGSRPHRHRAHAGRTP